MLRVISLLILLFPSFFSYSQTLIRESLGLNAVFGTPPLDKMDGFKVVRGYGSAASFCKEPEEYMFNPTWQNFKYDDYLADAKSRGMNFVLCLTKNFSFFTTNNSTQNENHPVPDGADKSDPASYILYGKLAFQIAARYGTKTVDTSLLKVKEFPDGHWQSQVKRSGLGLLYAIEIWNEADKWGGTFTAPEYFALLSACYDGHKGALGNDVGVMQADPDMKFIFTGTTDNTTTFTGNVRAIWEQQRGEPFPENIIFNFHVYFHDKAINNNNRTTGIAPELGQAMGKYKKWNDFSGNNMLAKTEYGYDTHPNSIQRAPLIARPDTGFYSIEESQAALILRIFHLQSIYSQMMLSTFYQLRDENPGDSFVYSTCGVTYGVSNGYAPKESYFILTGFIELSDGFFCNGTLLRQDPYIVRYQNAQGEYLYAVWTYEKNKFTIPTVTTQANSVMALTSTKDGINSAHIVPQNGNFSIIAQQMPVYYRTNSPLAFHVPVCQPISASNASICAGDSILIDGVYRKTSGFYYDTLVGNECDSIFVTQLEVNFCGELPIGGIITTETGTPVQNVSIQISGTENLSAATLTNGTFGFGAAMNGNYTISPAKNNDVNKTNGISTLDMVLIQQHILGVHPLSSPYKIIAADVNRSGTVTTLDILILRAFVLGEISTFPGNRLWEFVKSNEVFPDPLNPFPFSSERNLSNITQPQPNQNFIGIKLGDVNNSWNGSIP